MQGTKEVLLPPKNKQYRELVLRNRHHETQETHPTHYGESRPLPLARGNVITSDEKSRMTTNRESDFLINQEYDYKQNWTTRGPMKDEL